MVLAQDSAELLDDSVTVDNQACLSAWAPAQQPVYANAGPLAPKGSQGAAVQELRSVTAKPLQDSVVQAAVAMQSQLAAIGFVQIQQQKWHTCAGAAITVTPPGGGRADMGVRAAGDQRRCRVHRGEAARRRGILSARHGRSRQRGDRHPPVPASGRQRRGCPRFGHRRKGAPPMTEFCSVTGGSRVRSRSLTRAAGFLLVAAVAASCATEGTPVAETTSSSATSNASAPDATNAPSPTPKSDEDQMRDTVMAFQDAFNTQNWDAYLNLMCRAMREQFTAPVMERLKKTRAPIRFCRR